MLSKIIILSVGAAPIPKIVASELLSEVFTIAAYVPLVNMDVTGNLYSNFPLPSARIVSNKIVLDLGSLILKLSF